LKAVDELIFFERLILFFDDHKLQEQVEAKAN
jgi:hypothetical protein